jgi:negative regulator of sigma E activity
VRCIANNVIDEYFKMNDRHEQLSALLDDYRGSEEDRAALSELQSDVNQQYRLQRYGLIGDVLRNELPEHVQMDFAARVRASIAAEPSLKQPPVVEKSRQSSGWLSSIFKPLAGLAVAASVAVVAVTLVQAPSPQNPQQPALASADDLATQSRVEQLTRIPVNNNALLVSGNPVRGVDDGSGTSWKIKRGNPELQSRLNAYLINHNEYSNSMNGIIPQARVVGFDAKR